MILDPTFFYTANGATAALKRSKQTDRDTASVGSDTHPCMQVLPLRLSPLSVVVGKRIFNATDSQIHT